MINSGNSDKQVGLYTGGGGGGGYIRGALHSAKVYGMLFENFRQNKNILYSVSHMCDVNTSYQGLFQEFISGGAIKRKGPNY